MFKVGLGVYQSEPGEETFEAVAAALRWLPHDRHGGDVRQRRRRPAIHRRAFYARNFW